MSDRPSSSGRRGRPKGSATFPWRSFFQQSDTPVFVLGKERRLRFANAAWERLAGMKLADALGMVCTTRGNASKLAAAMCPTDDALAGKIDRARRPDPTTSRTGPPWWDVTFVPLTGDDGIIGIAGFIAAAGHSEPAAARKVSPFIAGMRDRQAQRFSLDLLRGESLISQAVVAKVRLAATISCPIWIHGEPGAGKQTAARVIHHAGAARERGFLCLDCEGLQPYLIEGLFFGHGGITGSGFVGTIYLKEPGNLPHELQQRMLDECAAGAPRLICGSAKDRLAEVRAGRLHPRFAGDAGAFEIHLPPLRERLEDLPRIAGRIVENRFAPPPPIDSAALDVLRAQPWPGNIRELADVLTAAGANPAIRAEHLPHAMRVRAGLPAGPAREPRLGRDVILQDVERRLILAALQRSGFNRTLAADMLEVPRAELYRRMKALGIEETGPS